MKLQSIAGAALIVLVVSACGGGASSVPPPAATAAFDDFDTAFCGAFTSLIRAVGNPDTGSPSVMSNALDDAVAAGDADGAGRAATAMLDELEAGRRQAAVAARWQPGAPIAAGLDRLLVAFEASTSAKRAIAARTPGAIDPQQAFEGAGGVAAWTTTLEGVGRMPVPAGASPKPCMAFTGHV